MSAPNDFVAFVLEQMTALGDPRARAMFGGHGIYQDGVMFALIADDRLYFKADAATQGDFEAKRLKRFTYEARGKTIALQYYEAPPEVFDEPDAMRAWASKALGCALRARKGGRGKGDVPGR
jgi:DNA transformation protein